MSENNILIVEDDKNIAKLVRYNLEKAGFNCHSTITGEDALEILAKEPIDLAILDIMLPKMDGLETFKRIKADDDLSSLSVMMLTAKGEEIDRILGFELGVDDYMVKPFSPRELVLRVKAILRRKKPSETREDVLSIGGLKIDVSRHEVFIGKKEVVLTAMEFKLLYLLIKRKGRVQSRDVLLDDVWNLSADVTTRTVDTHVKRLRQKLGKYGKMIETVRGYGYKLNDEGVR